MLRSSGESLSSLQKDGTGLVLVICFHTRHLMSRLPLLIPPESTMLHYIVLFLLVPLSDPLVRPLRWLFVFGAWSRVLGVRSEIYTVPFRLPRGDSVIRFWSPLRHSPPFGGHYYCPAPPFSINVDVTVFWAAFFPLFPRGMPVPSSVESVNEGLPFSLNGSPQVTSSHPSLVQPSELFSPLAVRIFLTPPFLTTLGYYCCLAQRPAFLIPPQCHG